MSGFSGFCTVYAVGCFLFLPVDKAQRNKFFPERGFDSLASLPPPNPNKENAS